MMHFLKGWNWQDGADVNFLGFTKWKIQRDMISCWEEEVDGLLF